MPKLSRVVVVYNPESSGDGEQLARDFQRELARTRPGLPVRLVPTDKAGHGRQLAAEAAADATAEHPVLVVSASGDGGYHDVVNGVLDAGGGERGVLAAVLAAGNANDHRRATRRRPLAEAVAADDVTRLDLLTLRCNGCDPEYAHSYIGLGLTAAVAVGLEKGGGKGSIGEVLTTVRVLRRVVPVPLERHGRRRRYDAVVASTIDRMAKVVTLDADSAPDDGRFEVVELGHLPSWRYPEVLLRAVTGRLSRLRDLTEYRVRTVEDTLVQLDGEVRNIPAGTEVAIGIAPGALLTVR